MSLIERVRGIPLTVRVPVMVASLMIVVSLIISERVLARLHDMQEQHLNGVVGTYFDGLSTALIPAVLRQDVWETYDLLDRTRTMFAAVSPIETVVTGRDGMVLASSDPHAIPVLSEVPRPSLTEAMTMKSASNGSRTPGSGSGSSFIRESRSGPYTPLSTSPILSRKGARFSRRFLRRMLSWHSCLPQLDTS